MATEIAAQVGHDLVSFSTTGAAVSVNGISDAAIASPDARQQLDGGMLSALSADSYQLTWATGETLSITDMGTYLNSSVQLSPQDGPGSVQGLLGTDSGQANDFALPDGTILAPPVATATLPGTFTDAWRVAPAASLLDAGSQDAPVRISTGNTNGFVAAMQFLQAATAAANDRIIATGGEILTGSAAAGLLNQAAIPGITLQGTLAALGSDIVTHFGSKDFIDITDFTGGSATVFGPGSATGVVQIAYGGKSADLSFSGNIPGSALKAISDGDGGTLIGYS